MLVKDKCHLLSLSDAIYLMLYITLYILQCKFYTPIRCLRILMARYLQILLSA